MRIRVAHTRGNGEVYTYKEVKFIKEYSNFILIEHPEGYKECINKQDLGIVKEQVKATRAIKDIYIK